MPSNKKKILFTSHTANFQKFNRPFMRMLREQGYEVHYASMGEEQIEDCDKQFVVPFTRSPFTLSNVRAYRQLKEIIDHEQYDLIHTHTPVGGVVTRLAARQARQRGTRVIYTAHGFHFFTGAPLLNWLVYYPIERLMPELTAILLPVWCMCRGWGWTQSDLISQSIRTYGAQYVLSWALSRMISS